MKRQVIKDTMAQFLCQDYNTLPLAITCHLFNKAAETLGGQNDWKACKKGEREEDIVFVKFYVNSTLCYRD